MSCLICKYFQPIEPQDHRELREAGRCEGNCGKEWNHYTAVRYIRQHRNGLDGFCRLQPEARRVPARHVCAQISVPEYYFNNGWGLRRLKSDDYLDEWAAEQFNALRHDSWESQRRSYLEEQNAELRRQLTASRAVSRKRLERLKKTEDKPAPIDKDQPKPIAGNVVPLLEAAE
jgi:hypothetical protein